MKLEELRRQLRDGTLYPEPEHEPRQPAGRIVTFSTPPPSGLSITEQIRQISQETAFSPGEVRKAFSVFGQKAKNVGRAMKSVAETAQAFNLQMDTVARAFKAAQSDLDSTHVDTRK